METKITVQIVKRPKREKSFTWDGKKKRIRIIQAGILELELKY